MTDYKALAEYCSTDRQREVFAALIITPSTTAVAKQLGVTRQNTQKIVKLVKTVAAKRLYAPEHGLTNPVPENFTGDFTIQRNGEGEIERSWMKGKADKTKQAEAYRQFIEGLSVEIVPVKGTKPPKMGTDQLASAIIFGDAHLGMLAHAIETLGEDHDLETATADIRMAIDYLVDSAPSSEEGWFVNVGDWTHADNTKSTTHNGTYVDTSARHNQVMRAAGATVRYCIAKMLTKFNKVIAINARGNHDKDAAVGLNMMLEVAYENEPRVDVRGNDAKFNFIEFGQCLIGITHGDQINANRLAGVMTKNAAPAWGRTTFRRWWQGHIHHKQAFEHDSGVTIESFHTLAPLDAWHSDSGYGAEQRVTMITLHRIYGEVNRMSPDLKMIRAMASK